MSKNINVNPAHYKVAGRERQGEDIAQNLQKQAYGQRWAEVERWQSRHGQGAPGWENPAQPTAEPEPARPQRVRKAKPRRQPARARKAAASRATTKKSPAKKSPAKKSRKSAAARRTVKRPRRSGSTRARRTRRA